jgi:hypothetical protein
MVMDRIGREGLRALLQTGPVQLVEAVVVSGPYCNRSKITAAEPRSFSALSWSAEVFGWRSITPLWSA